MFEIESISDNDKSKNLLIRDYIRENIPNLKTKVETLHLSTCYYPAEGMHKISFTKDFNQWEIELQITTMEILNFIYKKQKEVISNNNLFS